MKKNYDIVIIGCGPAGIAAALGISKTNLSAALFDEQQAPGGQIYRSIENRDTVKGQILGSEYLYGENLVSQFRDAKIDYFPNSSIWQLTKKLEIGVSRSGQSKIIKAKYVILATGAIERPFPIKGWTLPGVSTIGGAQILLKSCGLVEDNPVFIGSGPLLYLLGVQYLRAGINIKAILDTNPSSNKWLALPHLPQALAKLNLIYQGREWISKINKAGVLHIHKVCDVKLHGKLQLKSITYKTEEGLTGSIKANRALLHQGIVPNINLSMASGCDHVWDSVQLCWKPLVRRNGETTIPNLFIIGDGAGIIGSKASEAAGRIVATEMLKRLGKSDKSASLRHQCHWEKVLAKELLFRPFIDTLFQPRKNFRIPKDDKIIVCRCEEVTVGDIRKNIALGSLGPNQMKAYCRAGMGPCQGRLCGLTVSEIIANERKVPVSEVGYYRLRPPVKPLTLMELANLN